MSIIRKNDNLLGSYERKCFLCLWCVLSLIAFVVAELRIKLDEVEKIKKKFHKWYCMENYSLTNRDKNEHQAKLKSKSKIKKPNISSHSKTQWNQGCFSGWTQLQTNHVTCKGHVTDCYVTWPWKVAHGFALNTQ